MDNQNIIPELKELLVQLQNDGSQTEEIMEVVDEINKSASTKFYTEVMMTLTKEEIEKINKEAKTQEEADEEISRIYQERNGQEPGEVKNSIIADLAKAYLQKYLEQKSN